MAYILGKDLDNLEDSIITREPYSATDKEQIGAQYITGNDLLRSAKISSDWKAPVAIYAQAYKPISIPAQVAWSTWHGMEDTIHNLPYNVVNTIAQRAVELTDGEEKPKHWTKKLLEGTEIGQLEKMGMTLAAMGIVIPGMMEEAKTIKEKATTYDEMVDLLNERDYPLSKYAQRVIADTTNHVENRRLVRELYNQAQGIDSEAWYNQAGTIIGAMIPTIVASKWGYSSALASGAGRANAINTAMNIAKGYMTAEMAGQYAEETAAQYLRRTGDKNFENFTAKDASGLSAMAYGAIGAQIEFIGGIEPIMAGALQKVGLRSGLVKAGLKIAGGEATEELLQNVTELLMRKMEGSTDKTWGEGIKDALNGAVWGAFIGGLTGSPAFYVNRRNLVRGIKKALPQVSDAQATQIADAMIDTAAEASSQDQTLRNNLREKVSYMYKNIDLDNKEDRIDAITDLEYALATMDATDRGIDLTEHEIFQGEVTPIGWFRAGIPEAQRTDIQAIIDNITDLQTQLETLNKAKEKDWAKIEELESKLAQADQYVLDKLSELISKESFTRTLEKLEKKYVAKQKKKAGIPVDTLETTGKTYTDAEILGMFAKAKNDGSIKLDNWENVRWSSLLSAGDTYQKGKRNKPATEAEKAKFARKMLDKYMPGWNTVETTQQKPMFQEQFDLADENARLDDIYPAYDGETIRIIDPTELKQAQYEVIQRTNPMQDEYHVGIRSVNDIKTFDETIDDKDSFVWGDYSQEDAKRDLAKNEITIYSSKPIENGVFVSTSYRQAQEYAGGKGAKVYKKTVPLDYVAWISGDEGQFAITDVVGKKRSVYNSNGERIAQSEPALRNFYKWFGDSKVVDEQGRPLVVYHGSNMEFDTFDKNKGGFTTESESALYGFYFTSSAGIAESYANIARPEKIKQLEKEYQRLEKIAQKTRKASDWDAYQKVYAQYEELELNYEPTEKIYNVYLKIENPMEYDFAGKHWEEGKYLEVLLEATNKDNDGVIFRNSIDDPVGTRISDIFVAFEPTQIKSVDNRGTFSADTGNIYWQNRVSGAAPSTYRGAYIPQFRFIQRANKMDASTLSHEMAHDWFETNFYRYRNEKMSKDFMKAWGALEKALGVTEKDNVPPRKASEAFARAYEAWITSNEDWHKLINVDDKDKDAVAKLMQDYQNSLRDIYNDISNPYFKETWGKLGELKPELKAWFDRVVNITDLDVLVERGEMTEEQATNEKLNRAIDTVIENTTDEETAQTLKEVRTLNDTQRYEVEGGNKNSIQQRLSALAKEIDENNMISKGSNYDTRRDMMAVAEAADNFVKTRFDDALAIINGQMAEVEGLFKEDLYTALERLAIENGDLGLIDELKNSEIANRLAKELGQRVAGFRNFKQSTDLDVVSALKSLDNKFNEALKNKKAKQEYETALKLLDESIKQQDKVADKELDSFLKDLECK